MAKQFTKTAAPAADKNTEIEQVFAGRIEASQRHKRTFVTDWKRNIEARLGRPFTTPLGGVVIDAVDSQTEINPDWALTKTKTANLFSQVPAVRGEHENKKYAKAIPIFTKALNFEIGEKRSNLAVPMEEVLNDMVNASGVGAILVQYVARFESVDVPAESTIQTPNGPMPVDQVPPDMLQQLIDQKAIPVTKVQRPTDYRFSGSRISPGNLLWPSDFAGSNFDDGDFIGHDGEMDWASAQLEFGLGEEDKDSVVGGVGDRENDLRDNDVKSGRTNVGKVHYTELFYWRYRVDPQEKSFSAIWRLVYVQGKEKPVKHEPWKGQRYNEQTRKYQGACKFPIRVGTLTYISDHPVPPSDSQAGRPQVFDMRRSRSQMFLNRERSIPMRWFDVNRIDPMIQETIMRGNWQAAIPSNGDGNRSMGEIARASYPSEDFSFDNMTKSDLMETWQVGPNQMGTIRGGDQTAAEAGLVQQNFATRIGQERAKIAQLFLSTVEVMAGLMVLYSDFPNLSDEEKQVLFQTWDLKTVLPELVLTIRPDSAIVLDSEQRIQRLMRFLNMTAKSGYVNPVPIIAEMAELSGVDPSEVLIQPTPKEDEPNLSWRFSGKDDLMNPVVVALLDKMGKLPTPENLTAAKNFLLAAQQPPAPEPPPAQPMGQPGVEGAEPSGPPSPPPGGGPGAPATEGAHPDWHLMPKVAARSRDALGG